MQTAIARYIKYEIFQNRMKCFEIYHVVLHKILFEIIIHFVKLLIIFLVSFSQYIHILRMSILLEKPSR